MVKKTIISIALLLSISSICFAAINPMDEVATQNALADKTITTIDAVTLNGQNVQNTFVGYFSKDGKMTGSFNTPPESGPQTDQGAWRVNPQGQFCFIWDHWEGHKERCVVFYQLANAILVLRPDNGFETLVFNENIKSGNQMQNGTTSIEGITT